MRKEILILFIMMTTVVGAGENPFYKPFDGPHGTAPFSRIKIEHFEPAFEKAIAEHKAEIDDIANNIEVATFSNTIEKMEYAGEMLTRVSSVFYNLLGTESNDEMMEISQRMSPKLSMHSNYINLNEKLFSRVKYIFEKRDELALSNEQKRLVEKYYEGFENSGATLSTEGKEKYRELSMELSKATLEFGQNVLRETNAYEMLLTEEDDLAGLPKSLIDAAAAKAKSKEKGGWIFDLTGPSYVGFMQYSSRRDLREKLYMAYNTKNVMGGQFDNREIVQKIVNIRLEIAKLLGYNSYSDYVLKNRMAKSAEGVFGLLDKLAESFTPIAQEEVKAVQEFAGEMEGNPIYIQSWDWSFYSDKLKDSMFGVNDEMTRPYFELERVKQGVFGLATDLYGLQFKKNDDIEVYNSEVEAFDVMDENGKFLSVLYTDFHPRKSKRSGAWMSSFKN
ncbi:MAG TPA: M3 family metallopeptidase, partial [Fermentimonas sp.]|nr:M3 family metallopeptidase [Fermentimonas sp.]